MRNGRSMLGWEGKEGKQDNGSFQTADTDCLQNEPITLTVRILAKHRSCSTSGKSRNLKLPFCLSVGTIYSTKNFSVCAPIIITLCRTVTSAAVSYFPVLPQRRAPAVGAFPMPPWGKAEDSAGPSIPCPPHSQLKLGHSNLQAKMVANHWSW